MIEFRNVRTNERVQLTRPHQIGAYINSSDLHVNSSKGQDFGWRLAPELVIKIEDMSQDPQKLDEISRRIGVPIDEITTIHLAQYLSSQDDLEQRTAERRKAREPEFKQEYLDEIEALKNPKPAMVVETVKPTVKKK